MAILSSSNQERLVKELTPTRPVKGLKEITKEGDDAMRIETYGQSMEVTPALRDYVETKLQRLGRHFSQPLECRTQLGFSKPDFVAEATINFSGHTLHAHAGAQTMYAAIDMLADKLDRLVLKHRRKQIDQQHGIHAGKPS